MGVVEERIGRLREQMIQSALHAWIVPGTDPHMSEYLPEEWTERAYISGFTGSMGFIVITRIEAGLWTDSRYFMQAETQLAGTGIKLFKKGIKETPEPMVWLCDVLNQGDTIGLNPLLFPVSQIESMQETLNQKGITIQTNQDLLAEMRRDKQHIAQPAMLLDEIYSGESTPSKLHRVRSAYKGNWMSLYTALDQIAWLFNVRGKDVVYNPVVVSYAIVSPDKAYFFVDREKLDEPVLDELTQHGIEVLPYDSIFEFIRSQPSEIRFIADKSSLNYALYNAITETHQLQHEPSLVNRLKSVKNKIELSGFKKAMVSDGIALTRFLMWFEKALEKGIAISEYEIGVKLKHYRSQQSGFVAESFCTIASFNENGAIVHYSPPEKGSKAIVKNGILLIDSGGQYLYGTTDITRTLSTGKVPQKAMNDFTRVLQGHIGLATAVFPAGTRGVQIDVLARDKMWKAGLDYGHGTGHGVGHFLNVHEGPQTIRKEGNDVVLEPGMVMTIEPGLYRRDHWGLRVENMVCITGKTVTDFGTFLEFENLTLFPIDLKLINLNLLTIDEIDWLNKYHTTVFKALSPMLEPDEENWLKEKTRQI